MTKVIGLFAMTPDGVIGKNNKLPWNIPEDLKHFKDLTNNNAIIMGKKTFESIGSKGLNNRCNIVVSTQENPPFSNADFVNTIQDAIRFAKSYNYKKIFIIGGSYILNYCFRYNYIDDVIQTEVPINVGGPNLSKINLKLYNKHYITKKTELLKTNSEYGKIKIHYKVRK